MKRFLLVILTLSLLTSTVWAKASVQISETEAVPQFKADLFAASDDVLLPADAAFAPEVGWEIYGSYGFCSLNTIAMMIASALGMVFTAPAAALSDEEEDYDFADYGIFNVGADYYFGEHLYAGVTGTFQYFRALQMNAIFSSIMAETGVQYGWSRFKFYHALAAGIGLAGFGSSETAVLFAFNVTILGMKFRVTDGSWIFLESNAGQKGFIQAGARFRM